MARQVRQPAATTAQPPPARHTYPAFYKLRILDRYDQLDKAGKTRLLREEGLRASLVSQWRAQRHQAALEAMSAEPGGQPVRRIHASDSLWLLFGQAAANLGYRPGQLLRIVMRYYAHQSNLLPDRPPMARPPSPPGGETGS